jgi:hypothetical protein
MLPDAACVRQESSRSVLGVMITTRLDPRRHGGVPNVLRWTLPKQPDAAAAESHFAAPSMALKRPQTRQHARLSPAMLMRESI